MAPAWWRGVGSRRLGVSCAWRLGLGLALIGALFLSGCSGDDGGSSPPTSTPTSEIPEPEASPTPTVDFGGGDDTPTPTATLGPCPTAVAVQCATECGTLGGCCAIAAPGSGVYSCFDPSVTCGFPCETQPANWIGDTPCGPAPGNDPS